MHQFYSDIFQRVGGVRRGGRRGRGRRGGRRGRAGRRREGREEEGGEGGGEEKRMGCSSSLQIQNGEPWQEPSYLNAVLQEVLQSQYPSLEKRYCIHSTWDAM